MSRHLDDMERIEWNISSLAWTLWQLFPKYDARPIITNTLNYRRMDKQSKKLCDAINTIHPDIITEESCCGHNKDNFRIWFQPRGREIY